MSAPLNSGMWKAANDEQKKLAAALRCARISHGYIQKIVASKICISYSSMSRLELGQVWPSDEIVNRLLDFYGMTMDQLQKEAGVMPAKPVTAEPVYSYKHKHETISEAPEVKKPEVPAVTVVSQDAPKMKNGMTPLQNWHMTMQKLQMLGRMNGATDTMRMHGRFGRYENSTFYWYGTDDQWATACKYLNHERVRKEIETFMGSISGQPVKFMAVREPDVERIKRLNAEELQPVMKQHIPVTAKAGEPLPVKRYGPVEPVKDDPVKEEKPVVKCEPVKEAPKAESSKTMTAGAQKLLTVQERQYLVHLIRTAIKNQIKAAAENNTMIDPTRYGMLCHIAEVLEG